MEATAENFLKITKQPLMLTTYLGIHPLKPFYVPFTICSAVPIIITTILIIWMPVVQDLDSKKFSRVLESFIATATVWSRVSTLVIRKPLIAKLFRELENFWNSTEIKTDILGTVKFLQRSFGSLATIGTVAYMFRPYVTGELAMECYVPSFVPYYIFITFNQFSAFVYLICVVSVDLLSTSIVLIVTLQFKILQLKLRKLNMTNIEEGEEEIKACVLHHRFLLGYVNTFNEIFSFNQFMQIFVSEFFMCSQLVILVKNPNDAVERTKCIFVVFVLGLQLLLYTWSADQLTEESNNLTYAIYDSDWYNCDSLSIRKQLIIMMQNVQTGASIEGGPFFTINLTTTTLVFKTTFTLFTFLNNF